MSGLRFLVSHKFAARFRRGCNVFQHFTAAGIDARTSFNCVDKIYRIALMIYRRDPQLCPLEIQRLRN